MGIDKIILLDNTSFQILILHLQIPLGTPTKIQTPTAMQVSFLLCIHVATELLVVEAPKRCHEHHHIADVRCIGSVFSKTNYRMKQRRDGYVY